MVGPVGGYVPPKRSVYDEFKRRGYSDCELFGVTYLSQDEQENAAGNYHRPEKYVIIREFIEAVKAYTGQDKVDLVTHSLGVSMSLATLKHYDAWDSVRRFVNIAGGIRGLNSCLFVGPANLLMTTCGSENLFSEDVFGFYPDSHFGLMAGPGRRAATVCVMLRRTTQKWLSIPFLLDRMTRSTARRLKVGMSAAGERSLTRHPTSRRN